MASVPRSGTPEATTGSGTIGAISPEELARRANGEHPPWILDVRPSAERRWATLPRDHAIPLSELPSRVGELPHEGPIVVYCRTGLASHQAAAFLHQHGFPEVAVLEGGIDAYARSVEPSLLRYAPEVEGPRWILQQLPRWDTGCLAYLLGDPVEHRAVLIDPGRDIDPYLQLLRSHDLRLVGIVETHTHADHLSGHAQLHERTEAPILLGRRSGAQYPHRSLADGDAVEVGGREITVWETPGHTSDHLTLRFADKAFTGDTLLIGSCGRSDLGDGSPRDLWESLHQKLLTLPEATEILPAHFGPHHGLVARYSSTLGFERASNEALAQPDFESFRRYMTEGWPPKPSDFETIVADNLADRPGRAGATRSAHP